LRESEEGRERESRERAKQLASSHQSNTCPAFSHTERQLEVLPAEILKTIFLVLSLYFFSSLFVVRLFYERLDGSDVVSSVNDVVLEEEALRLDESW
jgi:hypothetical protein